MGVSKEDVCEFVESMKRYGWDDELCGKVVADSSDGIAFFLDKFAWDGDGLNWWCTDMPDTILAYSEMFEAAADAKIKLDRIFVHKDDWDGAFERFESGEDLEVLFPPEEDDCQRPIRALSELRQRQAKS